MSDTVIIKDDSNPGQPEDTTAAFEAGVASATAATAAATAEEAAEEAEEAREVASAALGLGAEAMEVAQQVRADTAGAVADLRERVETIEQTPPPEVDTMTPEDVADVAQEVAEETTAEQPDEKHDEDRWGSDGWFGNRR